MKVSSHTYIIGTHLQGNLFDFLFAYFWSERTISVRNIAEVEIAKQVIEVVSRYLSKPALKYYQMLFVAPVKVSLISIK